MNKVILTTGGFDPITLISVMCFEKDKPEGYKLGNGKKGVKFGKRGTHNKKWYYNPITLNNIMCLPEHKPEGYIKGRAIKKKRRW
jgi:hypothetical protein